MKTTSLAAARRYARALLDVALQADVAEAVRLELRDGVALLAAQPELVAVLQRHGISLDRRKKVALAVWAEGRASEIFRRLIGVLLDNGRFGLLPQIEESFTTQWNLQRRVASAEIVSAVSLEDAQTRAIALALEAVTGKGVEAAARIDPGLLGGVLVRVEGRTYDGTVRARLHALRERLAAGA